VEKGSCPEETAWGPLVEDGEGKGWGEKRTYKIANIIGEE